MSISKAVVLTVNGYTSKLSSQLQFYKGDTLHLIFSVNEYGIVVNGETSSRSLMPIVPLKAFLLIENADGVDYVESTDVTEEKIHFQISNKYTSFIGIGRMQLILTDDQCCRVTLPEFNFEVKENIVENSDLYMVQAIIGDYDNYSITDENGTNITIGNVLTTSDIPIANKHISTLRLKGILDGNESVLIQDETGTKQTSVNIISNYILDNYQFEFQDEISGYLSEELLELTTIKESLQEDINNAYVNLASIKYLKKQYQTILNNLKSEEDV